jgi:ABC-type Na+ efflux pump permease subunit
LLAKARMAALLKGYTVLEPLMVITSGFAPDAGPARAETAPSTVVSIARAMAFSATFTGSAAALRSICLDRESRTLTGD